MGFPGLAQFATSTALPFSNNPEETSKTADGRRLTQIIQELNEWLVHPQGETRILQRFLKINVHLRSSAVHYSF
jgi:hypothetical protein